MIILLYMRSLRLLSIVLFIVICGPLLLICWYKNRPAPTENPDDLIKNFPLIDDGEKTNPGYVNVAARFRFFFGFACAVSIAQVFIGLLAFCCHGSGSSNRSCITCFYKFTWVLITFDWILAFFFRF